MYEFQNGNVRGRSWMLLGWWSGWRCAGTTWLPHCRMQMCGKWYRGTLDRDAAEFDSESAEKGAERVYRNRTAFAVAVYAIL